MNLTHIASQSRVSMTRGTSSLYDPWDVQPVTCLYDPWDVQSL